MSLVQYSTPLNANTPWNSAVNQTTRATAITGSVWSDVAGTVSIQQGGDGINFDIINNITVPANTGVAINIPVYDQYFQVVYTNGNANQTGIRLFIDLRDPYGTFLAQSQAPSPGGNYLVLFQGPNGSYQVVGRFQAGDGVAANANAAIYTNQSGQYASFPVANATVSVETVILTTEHSISAF